MNDHAHPRNHHVALALWAALSTGSACASSLRDAPTTSIANDVEDIYVLRSIREPREAVAGWCDATRTGFEPFPNDPERYFSFWSVDTQTRDGSVVDASAARVAEIRACFGPTSERARQNFYAELALAGLAFRGRGECVAVGLDVPETGLIPVRCQLVLSDGPAPYVGGLLTTNTLTSGAAFGGESEPPGYVQASIATIRVWKARTGLAPSSAHVSPAAVPRAGSRRTSARDRPRTDVERFVVHPKFGRGRVVREVGDKLEIDFDEHGRRLRRRPASGVGAERERMRGRVRRHPCSIGRERSR